MPFLWKALASSSPRGRPAIFPTLTHRIVPRPGGPADALLAEDALAALEELIAVPGICVAAFGLIAAQANRATLVCRVLPGGVHVGDDHISPVPDHVNDVGV